MAHASTIAMSITSPKVKRRMLDRRVARNSGQRIWVNLTNTTVVASHGTFYSFVGCSFGC
jgi:hypothetical protein